MHPINSSHSESTVLFYLMKNPDDRFSNEAAHIIIIFDVIREDSTNKLLLLKVFRCKYYENFLLQIPSTSKKL